MILVTGAAGKTGRALFQVLKEQNEPVRAYVRRPGQASLFDTTDGCEVFVGDLQDVDCLAQACQGIRALYHIPPNMSPDEVAMGKAVIQAAKDAHVEHFVYHSVLHPQIEAMPHHWNKLRVEEMLFESGLNYTILQPAVYMQNILPQWRKIVSDGVYSIPYGEETRISQVDLVDIAGVGASVLVEPGHQGATYELVGTPPLSPLQISKELSLQLHRPVEVKVMPIEEWERSARASGLGDYQVSTLIKMFDHYHQYGLVGNPNTLTCLLGRQPNTFVEFINRINLEQGDGNRVI